mgnify:CR=1 FL=1
MHAWWLGAKRFVEPRRYCLGAGYRVEQDKRQPKESKVFELYQAGKLAEIREYNLNDVRVTRKSL